MKCNESIKKSGLLLMTLNPKISGSVRIRFFLSMVRGLQVAHNVITAVSLPVTKVPSLHNEPCIYICRVRSVGLEVELFKISCKRALYSVSRVEHTVHVSQSSSCWIQWTKVPVGINRRRMESTTVYPKPLEIFTYLLYQI